MTRKIRSTDRNGKLVLFACGMTEDCLQLITGEGVVTIEVVSLLIIVGRKLIVRESL